MTLLLFIVILSILVFVHELGHFVAARKAGIKVEEFGFGLPPRIWGKKVGETIYSINAFPIGGFVKLFGEDGGQTTEDRKQIAEDRRQKTEGAFFQKSIPRRLSVLLAGVSMNLVLGIVCFSILYFIWGIPTKTGKIMVEAVLADSPAQSAEIKPKDVIVTIDGQKITQSSQLIEITNQKAGEEIELEIAREKESLFLSLIPRKNPPQGEGPLGVVITDTEFKKYPFYSMPFLGIREGFKESLGWGKMVLLSLKTMIVSLVLQGRIPKEVAGPVGIYQITGQAAKAGWMAVLQFVGILSVNLAIMNILPLPAVDGGRVMFLIYEAIFRKKANPKIEMWVNQIGMMALLALMALITVNDVVRLIKK